MNSYVDPSRLIDRVTHVFDSYISYKFCLIDKNSHIKEWDELGNELIDYIAGSYGFDELPSISAVSKIISTLDRHGLYNTLQSELRETSHVSNEDAFSVMTKLREDRDISAAARLLSKYWKNPESTLIELLESIKLNFMNKIRESVYPIIWDYCERISYDKQTLDKWNKYKETHK